MKLFLSILVATFLAFSAHASHLSNCVEGLDSSGDSLTGTFTTNKCMQCNTCDTINHCENVSGRITDQNDNTRSYKGHWDGYDRIVGLADDGTRVILDVVR